MYVSLGRFQLIEDSPLGCPAWVPPAGVSALVDLVPPKLDAEPAVNFALMLSDTALDSSDAHYTFGAGHVTELTLSGTDRDAWESVTGYRPQANTIADCLAEHLLRSPADDRANPLTCGANRGLEIHLDGVIWSHTLYGLTDPFSQPVLRIEAEGLASIYREEGETQYRLAMGGLRRKYDTRPIKELIAYLFPSGRDDLPLLDELQPQTLLTENWPSSGTITTGQDNSWSVSSGAWTVSSIGTARCTSTGNLLLGYTFGGSDRKMSVVLKNVVASTTHAVLQRSDASAANAMVIYEFQGGGNSGKFVAGAFTQIGGTVGTFVTNDTLWGWSIGSTHTRLNGATSQASFTDTSIAAGTRSLIRGGVSANPDFGIVTSDDQLGGGGSSPTLSQLRRSGTRGIGRAFRT